MPTFAKTGGGISSGVGRGTKHLLLPSGTHHWLMEEDVNKNPILAIKTEDQPLLFDSNMSGPRLIKVRVR